MIGGTTQTGTVQLRLVKSGGTVESALESPLVFAVLTSLFTALLYLERMLLYEQAFLTVAEPSRAEPPYAICNAGSGLPLCYARGWFTTPQSSIYPACSNGVVV